MGIHLNCHPSETMPNAGTPRLEAGSQTNSINSQKTAYVSRTSIKPYQD